MQTPIIGNKTTPDVTKNQNAQPNKNWLEIANLVSSAVKGRFSTLD